MKFGFATIPRWPMPQVIDLITQAEELGYDTAWIPDQTFFVDPFALLAAAGQHTKRIRLGIGVTNPYARLAAQVARAIGTVSNLTRRPVGLGIGAGNRKELLLPLGIEQEAPAARCREMIELVRWLLAGETVTYESKWVTMKEIKLLFEPSHPVPIYLAARGPMTLQIAGEVADGVIIGDLISDGGLNYAHAEISKGLKKAGRAREELEHIMWATCFVAEEDDNEVLALLRPWVAHHLAASPPVVQYALGMEDERIQRLRAAYSKGGAEAASRHVTLEDIDKLALIGSPDRLAATVQRLVRRGIDQLVILLYARDLQTNRNTLAAFASEVIPLV